jgi:hypothetical protein
MSTKEKASMGLRFQQAVTLDNFLDGYNAQLKRADKQSRKNGGNQTRQL